MMQCEELDVKCATCNSTVSVTSIHDHQRHHNALKMLKFKPFGRGPTTVDILLKRRRLIIKKIVERFRDDPSNPDLLRRINLVNESFDIIRSELSRGRSLCHCLCPLTEKAGVGDGGLALEEEDLINDIKSTMIISKLSEPLPYCMVAVGTCTAMNIEYKDVNEDRMTIRKGFSTLDKNNEDESCCFIGIYDGYCGSIAAERSCEGLHTLIGKEVGKLRNQPPKKPPLISNEEKSDEIIKQLQSGLLLTSTEDEKEDERIFSVDQSNSNLLSCYDILKCCRRAYKTMDDQLAWGIKETSRVRWSGCSAATCIVSNEVYDFELQQCKIDGTGDKADAEANSLNGRIFMSNAGDVEAYICHNNKPYALTQCHTIRDQHEINRVRAAGGKIIGCEKNLTINSVMATSRGLGNHGDLDLRKCVICDPHTSTARINHKTQFLVMATTSVWSKLNVNEVFFLLKNTPVPWSADMRAKTDSHSAHIHDSPLEDDSLEEQRASKLPSIVETDEDWGGEIEEVVIVHPGEVEYDDSITSDNRDLVATNNCDASSPVSRCSRVTDSCDSDELLRGQLAKSMCERLVNAALAAGATDNISVVVVLFKGFFT